MNGVLIVTPPATEARSGVAPDTVVAGLPLIRRIALAGLSVGYGPVLVRSTQPTAERLLAGTAAAALTATDRIPAASRRRVVLLPGNVLPQPSWLQALQDLPIDGETLYVDPSGTMVIETDRAGAVVAAAARCASAADLGAELRRTFRAVDRPLDAAGRFPLNTLRDVRAAEGWLLRSLVKRSEGFMSRHVERRLSLALTRRLVATGITPNAMTLVSVAIGLCAAPFFLSSSPGLQLLGALLLLVHSIVDGCDGELARLTFRSSRRGAILDFWGDNVVHVAVFGCIAIGWSLHIRAGWPLALGAVAVAGTLGSAVAVFGPTVRDAVPARDAPAGARLAEALAHRDFLYVIVLLAAFGRAAWFLILVAAGTPLFMLLVLHARRRGRGR